MNKKLPKRCLVDTNVPKTANLAIHPNEIPKELDNCVIKCIEAIEFVVKKGHLVIDAGDEIFNEYRQQLSMSGQPGVGDHFMKWVHDKRWTFPASDRVKITKRDDSYEEYPTHKGLEKFDPSDRKFIAVANAHPEKPPILEATDSKWWGYKDTLSEVGIKIEFLCPKYIESKYNEKFK